jgi:hypothetical protein
LATGGSNTGTVGPAPGPAGMVQPVPDRYAEMRAAEHAYKVAQDAVKAAQETLRTKAAVFASDQPEGTVRVLVSARAAFVKLDGQLKELPVEILP